MDLSSTPPVAVSTRFRTHRLSAVFGVEIEGLDLRRELDDAEIVEIRRLWNEHGLVLVRGQEFSKTTTGKIRRPGQVPESVTGTRAGAVA